MKHFYPIVFLVFCLSAQSQIVNIPDANFKNYLLNGGVDTNSDGEIQESEADAIHTLDPVNAGIVSLEGVQAFTNLTTLHCSNNQITELNLSGMPSLYNLSCDGNQLTTLDLSGLDGLKWIMCENNQLTSIVFPDHSMSVVNISYNQLAQVDLPQIEPDSMMEADLIISGNFYTSINIPAGTLWALYCNDTHLTSLDLSGNGFILSTNDFSIGNNTDLQYINLKNGANDFCIGSLDECFGENLNIDNNPSLLSICVDNDLEASHFQLDGVSTTTYCSFVPGGAYNTIAGNINFDLDGNGCDAFDNPAINVQMGISVGANQVGKTFTNSLGNYTAYTSSLNHTITPLLENPYFSILPASFTTSFSGTGNTAVVDFCITPNGIHPDLEITLIPIAPARPGFDATYKIHYKNKGTETQSGTVSLAFEDDVLDLVSANPVVSSQAANLLSWDFTNLVPFESREINFTLNVNSPLETPAVNNGDNLDFMASVVSGTDETPMDNAFEFIQTVVGSFDPNDKVVSRSVMDIAHLDEYLYYTVRFQNTGTFYAENVVVKDMLSSDLDLSTLQMVSASHQYRSTLTMGNKLEFFFEGINLPASADDEPGSHGFVTFKIKPKSTTLWGTDIKNTAEIYFDFNLPIVTNEVTTNVSALGVGNFSEVVANVYPNPAKNNFTVELAGNNSIENIAIYNTLGQMLKAVRAVNQESQIVIDVSGLQSGTYVVSIETDKGKTNKKLVKL